MQPERPIVRGLRNASDSWCRALLGPGVFGCPLRKPWCNAENSSEAIFFQQRHGPSRTFGLWDEPPLKVQHVRSAEFERIIDLFPELLSGFAELFKTARAELGDYLAHLERQPGIGSVLGQSSTIQPFGNRNETDFHIVLGR